MRIIAVAIFLFSVMFVPVAQAEDSNFDLSGYIGLQSDWTANVMGLKLGDGVHLQGGPTLSHNNSGLFGEIWISTDGVGASDGAGGEWDWIFGRKWAIFNDSVSVQADYAVFNVEIGSDVFRMDNARLFLTSNRDGFAPYAKFQYIIDDGGIGVGSGLAYQFGVQRGQYALEFGGHDGLFGQNAQFATYTRLKYGTEPLEWLNGAVVDVWAQKGYEDPVDDRFTLSVSWFF